MYIARVPSRKSPPTILLRQSWREGTRVKNRTLANLTRWPADKIEALEQVLKGRTSFSPPLAEAFTISRARPTAMTRCARHYPPTPTRATAGVRTTAPAGARDGRPALAPTRLPAGDRAGAAAGDCT
jgi:hypothetical protein